MHKKKEWVYRCEYCGKPYFSQSGCKKHESWCFNNTDKKSCITCSYSVNGDPCIYSTKYRNKKISTNNGNSNVLINCTGYRNCVDTEEAILDN